MKPISESPVSIALGVRQKAIYLAFLLALVATAGSFFFSEVMKLPPCLLCWYQRIAMYPMVAILATGIIRRDVNGRFYGLPFALIGTCIAAYHNLLYYHLIPESITPCTSGVSCTSKQIEWLGFITIPLMSFVAFVAILFLLVTYQPKGERNEEGN